MQSIKSDETSQKVQKFDAIIDTRTGFGLHQFIILLLLGLTQGILLSLDICVRIFLNQILLDQFKFDPHDVIIANTLLFVGVLVGGLLTGFLSNKFGRRNLILFSIFIMILIVLMMIFLLTPFFTYLNRFLYGFFNIQLFTAFVMVSEIFPQKYKGRGQIFLNVFTTFGILTSSYIINQNQDNPFIWKSLFLGIASSFTLILIINYFFLDESPKYLVNMGYCEDAINKLNQIGQRNQANFQLLQEDEQDCLRQYAINIQEESQKSQQKSIIDIILSSRETGSFVLILWFVIFSLKFLFNGTGYMLPFLTKDDAAQYVIFFQYFGTFPGMLLSFLLVDKSLMPKKNFIAIAILIAFFNLLAIYFFEISYLIFGISLIYFLYFFIQGFATPLCNESFSTQDRSIGLLSQQAIGAFGSSATISLSSILMGFSNYLPFLVYSFLVLIALILLYFLPTMDGDRKLLQQDFQKSQQIHHIT